MDRQEMSLTSDVNPKPKYETPTVKVMDESEVLTAFQVTAAGASMWWVE
jgi:hypothetical protein